MKKSTKIVLGSVAGVILIAGITNTGGEDTKAKPNDSAAVQVSDTPRPKSEDKPAEPTKTTMQEFQACVAKSGTAAEKTAVKHVVKLTGMDDWNNIMDAPEVYTDFTGGFMSTDSGSAKLVASAFAGCYKSDNGLVTVYGADGEMISNGKF